MEKYEQCTRRCWRKRHLAVDANSNLIVACVLTEQEMDDPSQVGPLLEQIPADVDIDQVTADGAYDEEPTYQTIVARQSEIAVPIAPRDGAVLSQANGAIVTPGDVHVLLMESLGRLGWQEATGFGKGSVVETAMGRCRGSLEQDCVRAAGPLSNAKRPSARRF